MEKQISNVQDEQKVNELIKFTNEELNATIRTIIGENEEPWFCLKDLCDALELGNASQVKVRLTDDLISNEVIPDALGRMQEATFVNEDGMYEVILDSRKPEAKRFRKWIRY